MRLLTAPLLRASGWLRGLGWLLLTLAAALAWLWGCGALWYFGQPHALLPWLTTGGWTALWVLLGVDALRQPRLARSALAAAVLLGSLLLWWVQLAPQAQRNWADDVAHITHIQPDPQFPADPLRVELAHVRNFDWRSDTDYTPGWETRQYDLRQLHSVDVGLSYWMGPAIAHTLVSFGFADGEHVVFSFEIRKRQGQAFDALAGFFKQYELALIAADERDILAVRTNVRGESLHLYRVHMSQTAMQGLFQSYAQQAAQLHLHPRWYHTLTANCTTIVWDMAQQLVGGLPVDWRLLASGYLPSYLAEIGALTPGYTLAQLEAASDITAQAQHWLPASSMDDTAARRDFSRAIRQGLPPVPATHSRSVSPKLTTEP